MSRQNKMARKRDVARGFTIERKARRAEEARKRKEAEELRAYLESRRLEREGAA
jgi:hypothetical protein